MKILVINPGGSSTKFSVFEGRQEILKRNIKHFLRFLMNMNTGQVSSLEYWKKRVIPYIPLPVW